MAKKDGHTAERKRLPDTRAGLTTKDTACGFEYFVTVNFYDDGKPAEMFVRIAKEGTAIAGFVEALCITISIALQYGVPWDVLHNKYLNQMFEPRDDNNPSLIHAIGNTADKTIKKWQNRNGMDTAK